MRFFYKKNVTLILSHVNLTFLQIGPPMPLDTLLPYNYYYFNCEEWSKHFYKLDPMLLDTLLP